MDVKHGFTHPLFENSSLIEKGLNLQAVFDIAHLPTDVYSALSKEYDDLLSYRQLVLIGHGGTGLWNEVSSIVACADAADHPIDSFSIDSVKQFFSEKVPDLSYRVVYPGSSLIPLQQLGELAGWHNDSPFKVGVNQVWGSWFAYRVCVLTDSDWSASSVVKLESPCSRCQEQPCITACPAGAMSDGDFHINNCIAFRQKVKSDCNQRCLARLACPIGDEHKYSTDQLSYHYSRSLRMIKQSMK